MLFRHLPLSKTDRGHQTQQYRPPTTLPLSPITIHPPLSVQEDPPDPTFLHPVSAPPYPPNQTKLNQTRPQKRRRKRRTDQAIPSPCPSRPCPPQNPPKSQQSTLSTQTHPQHRAALTSNPTKRPASSPPRPAGRFRPWRTRSAP